MTARFVVSGTGTGIGKTLFVAALADAIPASYSKVTAQTIALQNERNDVDILRRRMDASVLLIKALGGGWSASQIEAG